MITLELKQTLSGDLELIQCQINRDTYGGWRLSDYPSIDENTLGDKVKSAIDSVFIKPVPKSPNDVVKAKAKAAKEKADEDLKANYDKAFSNLRKTYPELVRHAMAHAYLGDYLFSFGINSPTRLTFAYRLVTGLLETHCIGNWVELHNLIEKYPNPKKTQESYLTSIKF